MKQPALWGVTYSDVPGAFGVGFVEAGEPLAANKACTSNQVSSTVEHRPDKESQLVHDAANMSVYLNDKGGITHPCS